MNGGEWTGVLKALYGLADRPVKQAEQERGSIEPRHEKTTNTTTTTTTGRRALGRRNVKIVRSKLITAQRLSFLCLYNLDFPATLPFLPFLLNGCAWRILLSSVPYSCTGLAVK